MGPLTRANPSASVRTFGNRATRARTAGDSHWGGRIDQSASGGPPGGTTDSSCSIQGIAPIPQMLPPSLRSYGAPGWWMASIVQQSSCFDPYVDADLSEFLLD